MRVSTPEAAELTKLLENIFRSVNIALVDELAMLTERMGIDIWEVVDAASTKPYGFMRFEPGPGDGRSLPAGGSLLPAPGALESSTCRPSSSSSPARSTSTCPTTAPSGSSRPSTTSRKPVKGSRILILGASYKGGVGDVRESPALRIIEVLASRGGIVSYHDDHVPSLPSFGLESVPLDDAVAEADAVVLVTAHPEVDHAAVAARSALFVDLRGVTRGLQVENLVRL